MLQDLKWRTLDQGRIDSWLVLKSMTFGQKPFRQNDVWSNATSHMIDTTFGLKLNVKNVFVLYFNSGDFHPVASEFGWELILEFFINQSEWSGL